MVRSTVKTAILMGDSQCISLIASSVYDTKPVHYLSTASIEIKWFTKDKLVYNINTGKKKSLQFLRLNQINTYNNSMGDVDQVDQVRGSYRFNTWIKNRKWWWSLYFWDVGVTLTNAYIFYVWIISPMNWYYLHTQEPKKKIKQASKILFAARNEKKISYVGI